MNNNDLILEIKTILKETDKSGFGIYLLIDDEQYKINGISK